MKTQDIDLSSENILDFDTMDISSSCVIVISDGKAKIRELPEHGEYKIVTFQGRVKRMRMEEGEEF